MEGADLDPLGVNGGHGGFEVTELLLLLAVKTALTTGLLRGFVVAALLVRHAAESGEIPRMGELIPSGNGDDQADYGLLGNNR